MASNKPRGAPTGKAPSAKKGPTPTNPRSQASPKASPSSKRPSAPSQKKQPPPGPPKGGSTSLLAVLDAGVFLDDAAARAIWVEFSAYMDGHRNDFDGFAKLKGYRSIKPEHRSGRALLVIER